MVSSEIGKKKIDSLVWEGDWNPENAQELFDYIKAQEKENLFFGFELGNEVWESFRAFE